MGKVSLRMTGSNVFDWSMRSPELALDRIVQAGSTQHIDLLDIIQNFVFEWFLTDFL